MLPLLVRTAHEKLEPAATALKRPEGASSCPSLLVPQHSMLPLPLAYCAGVVVAGADGDGRCHQERWRALR